MKNKVLLFLCCLILAGCATQKWFKAGVSQAEFDGDNQSCLAEAYRKAPRRIEQVQVWAGSRNPVQTNCTQDYYGNNINCTSSGGDYNPPVMLSVDRNEEARQAEYRSCMYGKGYVLGTE